MYIHELHIYIHYSLYMYVCTYVHMHDIYACNSVYFSSYACLSIIIIIILYELCTTHVWIIPYTTAEGEDYHSGPFSVTIPAMDTSATFNVSIMIDNIFESDESFNLMINSSSFPSRVFLQPDCTLRITILNDDSKLLSFDLIITLSYGYTIYSCYCQICQYNLQCV